MRIIKYFIVVLFLMTVSQLTAQDYEPDSIKVEVKEYGDSMEFKVTVYQIETQLIFLMQGMNISIFQPDTLTMSFPSAAMVKHKVKRHPNEVKAVLEKQRKQKIGHDSINHVVRPDVQPLVAALNDTTAYYIYQDQKQAIQRYNIEVDRENAIMVFAIRVPVSLLEEKRRTLELCIYSTPTNEDRREFEGKHISVEASPRPNGLGYGIRKEDIARRTFCKTYFIILSNKNDSPKV